MIPMSSTAAADVNSGMSVMVQLVQSMPEPLREMSTRWLSEAEASCGKVGAVPLLVHHYHRIIINNA